jgi:hypothetical protein
VRAHVEHVVPARFEEAPHVLLRLESGVIGADGDLHGSRSSVCVRDARTRLVPRLGPVPRARNSRLRKTD